MEDSQSPQPSLFASLRVIAVYVSLVGFLIGVVVGVVADHAFGAWIILVAMGVNQIAEFGRPLIVNFFSEVVPTEKSDRFEGYI